MLETHVCGSRKPHIGIERIGGGSKVSHANSTRKRLEMSYQLAPLHCLVGCIVARFQEVISSPPSGPSPPSWE
jgi:hypothetical protein